MIPFNGGKMRHIFKPGKGCYEDGFSCDDAHRCWEDPASIVTLKVHGECCILIRKPIQHDNIEGSGGESDTSMYEWIFATRFDAKGKAFPENHIPLPLTVGKDGQTVLQPAVEGKHTYCFIPLEKEKVVGKGSKRSFVGRDTYAAIAQGVKNGDLPNPNDDSCPNFVTVEWIGRKHQGNMDCLDVDHALYVHGSTIVTDFPSVPRTREQVAALLMDKNKTDPWSIEGVVLYWPTTGERFKLRFDMLVPDSLFARNMKKSPVTPEFTSLKPRVIHQAAEEKTNDNK
jgi:hypothetical protein